MIKFMMGFISVGREVKKGHGYTRTSESNKRTNKLNKRELGHNNLALSTYEFIIKSAVGLPR